MKKLISLVISAALLSVLTACSQPAASSTPEPVESEPSSVSEASQPESSQPEPAAEPSEAEYEKAEFGALKVVNDLGFTVTGLYLSPTHADSWEENVLSDKQLPTGYSIDVNFPDGENARYWDIRVVGESKQEVVWYEFDLLTVGTVDLVISGGEMTAETYDR